MPVMYSYSITDFQDEVRALVTRGSIGRQQRIYELQKFFDEREWLSIERLLDSYDYVLRGRVIDLVGRETWLSD